jgi:hypothetical protein
MREVGDSMDRKRRKFKVVPRKTSVFLRVLSFHHLLSKSLCCLNFFGKGKLNQACNFAAGRTMATIESLRKRKDDIVTQFHDNAEVVRSIQKIAIEELVPDLKEELNLDEDAVASATKFLEDRG